MASIEAVVFDLDGTLVDSAQDILAALNHGMEQAGRPRMDLNAVRRIISLGLDRMVEFALEASGGLPEQPELSRIKAASLDFYQRHLVVHTCAYAGTIPMLTKFRDEGLRLGVCTNKLEAFARRVLAGLGMDSFFEVVVGRDSYSHAKPHPAPLLAALRTLSTEPSASLMVGDSSIDVACARAAGVPVIVVRYGYSDVPPDDLRADAVVDGAPDIAPTIAKM